MVNTKEVLSALEWITKNGELRDYDDEIANRIEDAKNIVQLYAELLAAAKAVDGTLILMPSADNIKAFKAFDLLHDAIAKAEQA